MSKIKKIGVLTSGGDCSGLNAAIRSVVLRASQLGWDVYGIIESTVGLMNRPLNYIKLSPNDVNHELLSKSGTILRSMNKGDPFNYPMPDGTFKDRSLEIVAGYKELGIDALIVIGGDGSMKIIEKITDLGDIRFIGIPKTIDNDVPFTESPIGYQTALNVAVQNIESLHATAYSHERVMIIEVMGRDVGHIALNAGIGAGADVILIPEIPYDIDIVSKKVQSVYATEKKYAIVVVSEAAVSKDGKQKYKAGLENKLYGGIAEELAGDIRKKTGLETRSIVLGHIQRSGSPCAYDRILASAFGVRAVDLLNEGKSKRVVGWLNRQVIDVDLAELTKTSGAVNIKSDLVKTARGLDISLGDI